MHPPDCPAWEYANHPLCRATLPTRVSEILADLLAGRIETLALATDTREVHLRIFWQLTPTGYDYYAGHYRGEPFRCLHLYRVMVPADPRVGAPPESVASQMDQLNAEIRTGLLALDANILASPLQRLQYALALASQALVAFLTIHPYANGNGHAGRLIVWGIMGRYGHWPQRWPVDPRPPDPPYSRMIVLCRDGNPVPLQQYLLQTLVS